MPEWLYEASGWIIPVIVAITFHEAAHGFVAYRLGDDTAYRLGRVSFNPLKHVDPFGTALLPGILFLMNAPFLFGYAKPVPVNFMQLRRLRRDAILVAFAGPGVNLLLALASALLLHLEAVIPYDQSPWLYSMLYKSMAINLVLAVFNMLPILPLDGGRILHALMPRPLARWYRGTERYGMLVVIGLFFIPALLKQYGLIDANILMMVVGTPVQFLSELVLRLVGIGQVN